MISVILPTYNESSTAVPLVRELKKVLEAAGIDAEIIVVDDSSPDGTAAQVRAAFDADPAVRLIVRQERGLGSGVRTGLLAARGDRVIVMDADFNHDPRQIPALLRRLEGADIVVGSRFVRGGGTEESRFRYWGSYLFNLLVRVALSTGVRDNLSGFFAARRAVLARWPGEMIFVGYGDYFIRLLAAARRSRASIIEVPTVYGRRPAGQSKTRLARHLIQYTRTVLRVRTGQAMQRSDSPGI
ncbi:MAG TPA: glycosyltransferase [bacterium]